MDLCLVEHSGKSIYHLKKLITILNVSDPWIPTSMLIVLVLNTSNQGCHGQGKNSGIWKFFQVREKSGNFIFSQGSLEKMKKSWKSQGISIFSPKKIAS